MSRVISCKYRGPRGLKGSKIIVDDGNGNRLFYDFSHALGREDKFKAAAQALCDRLNWKGALIGAEHKDSVFMFVLVDKEECLALLNDLANTT